MSFYLGQRSLSRLEGVHPDLVAVVKRAIEITEVDFAVLEGVRSATRQVQLLATGASTTMRSRHLTGHAVDLGAWLNGELSWHWSHYDKIYEAMRQAADELEITIEWGGHWSSLKDGPHYQLPWGRYPEEIGVVA